VNEIECREDGDDRSGVILTEDHVDTVIERALFEFERWNRQVGSGGERDGGKGEY